MNVATVQQKKKNYEVFFCLMTVAHFKIYCCWPVKYFFIFSSHFFFFFGEAKALKQDSFLGGFCLDFKRIYMLHWKRDKFMKIYWVRIQYFFFCCFFFCWNHQTHTKCKKNEKKEENQPKSGKNIEKVFYKVFSF